MTDVTVKNRKNLPAYVRTYVRRKDFFSLSVTSVICHPQKNKEQ